MKILYFDHAAATPAIKEAVDAASFCHDDSFGNPSSIHKKGQEAINIIDKARDEIAKIMKTGFRSVIFTSSATEANNLILRGVVKKAKREGRMELPLRIITSTIEHDSILKTARDMEEGGVEVIYINPDKKGRIDPKKVAEAINERTVCISIARTNGETGGISDIKKIGELVSEKREGLYPVFHTDAVQAARFEDVSPAALGAQAVTISAHKIGGIKGAGAIVFHESIDPKLMVASQVTGGSQEFNIRAGTENTAAIASFSEAIKIASKSFKKNIDGAKKAKKAFFEEVTIKNPIVKKNGSDDAPHILNLWVPKNKSEEVITMCDMAGLMISRGSACSMRSGRPGHTVAAIYGDKRADQSFRVSFSPKTTVSETKAAAKIFLKAIR